MECCVDDDDDVDRVVENRSTEFRFQSPKLGRG